MRIIIDDVLLDACTLIRKHKICSFKLGRQATKSNKLRDFFGTSESDNAIYV